MRTFRIAGGVNTNVAVAGSFGFAATASAPGPAAGPAAGVLSSVIRRVVDPAGVTRTSPWKWLPLPTVSVPPLMRTPAYATAGALAEKPRAGIQMEPAGMGMSLWTGVRGVVKGRSRRSSPLALARTWSHFGKVKRSYQISLPAALVNGPNERTGACPAVAAGDAGSIGMRTWTSRGCR